MPAQRKPAERRQRANTADVGVVRALPTATPLLPKPEPHWADQVVEGWNDFWSSPMAGATITKPTDAPSLRRLFEYRDRLLKALEAFDAEPIVVGSTGQPTMSPWAAEVHRLEAAVSKLEDKHGLSPLARLKLGVTFEEGVSLAARNAELLRSFQASQGA